MSDEYASRRERVLDAISPGVLLVPAGTEHRYGGTSEAFRQSSEFYYLTGFEEPDAVLVLVAKEQRSAVLFLRERDAESERWSGERLGVERAVERLGVDEAYPLGEMQKRLSGLFENTERLFYRLGDDRQLDDRVIAGIRGVRRRGKKPVWWPTSIIEPGEVTHALRAVKSDNELAHMMRAADISAQGHIEVMRAARPGLGEHELEAVLLQVFRSHGARRAAYPTIVGSGPNATILHYVANDRTLQAGDLVLVDAGCEYQHYAADITRTFPVSGRFTEPQAKIYDLVLAAQRAAIDMAQVGKSMEDVHQAALRVLTDGLIELGFIEGPVDEAIQEERYKPYFMHRTGHFLGLDVHDAGRVFHLGKPLPLEPMSVITVEPGLYVPLDAEAPPEYRGIGVRIEDDVLVAMDGPKVLTSSVPSKREDVEAACRC